MAVELTGDAIILWSGDIGKGALRVKLLSADHGLLTGAARKTKGRTIQPGDFVQMRWRVRLEDQLGRLTIEHHPCQIVAPLELDSLRLQMLGIMLGLLAETLGERVAEPSLYAATIRTLEALPSNQAVACMLAWEEGLLAALGFGLDYQRCAAEGCRSNDIRYVSPKTGRGVCADHGAPYAAKMFGLPECWRPGVSEAVSDRQYGEAYRIISFFLQREILPPRSKIPGFRQRFLKRLAGDQ